MQHKGVVQAIASLLAHLLLTYFQQPAEFRELCQASVWASKGGAPQAAEESVCVLAAQARVHQLLPNVLHIHLISNICVPIKGRSDPVAGQARTRHCSSVTHCAHGCRLSLIHI